MVDRAVLLALRFAFDDINCNRLFCFQIIVWIRGFVRQPFKVNDLRMTPSALELPDALQDGFDTRFHRGVHAWRAAALFSQVGLLLLRVLQSTLAAGLWTRLLSPAALVFRVFFIILFFFLLLFLVVREWVRLRNLSQIWELSLFSADPTTICQLLEFGEEDILLRIQVVSRSPKLITNAPVSCLP